MKGEQANYTINLSTAFQFAPKDRTRKALRQIKKFCWKHVRTKKVFVSNEVNEFLHKHSKNIPKMIKATLLKEDDNVRVFMEGGKSLPEYLKKRQEEKKKKEKKTAKKEEKKEEGANEEEEAQKRKLEDKKAKEEAAKASGIKRKTA